uniref:Transcription elongation factor 1 homolog n=1 Tax=Setaria viridis TaxID=4556 RepID=A0A4U6V857_SETVI|nr:hypothetical protein SEVIR_4G062002v2 [Setaria viridis]
MGKRKLKTSKSMAAPRKLLKLDTLFTCPFRGYPDAVGCHIDLKDRIAKASCRICRGGSKTGLHPGLSC